MTSHWAAPKCDMDMEGSANYVNPRGNYDDDVCIESTQFARELRRTTKVSTNRTTKNGSRPAHLLEIKAGS
jgi:hypothetical protein